MIACEVSSSASAPKVMVPRHCADTTVPLPPSVRYLIVVLLRVRGQSPPCGTTPGRASGRPRAVPTCPRWTVAELLAHPRWFTAGRTGTDDGDAVLSGTRTQPHLGRWNRW